MYDDGRGGLFAMLVCWWRGHKKGPVYVLPFHAGDRYVYACARCYEVVRCPEEEQAFHALR